MDVSAPRFVNVVNTEGAGILKKMSMNEIIEKYLDERKEELAAQRKKEHEKLLEELKLEVVELSDDEFEKLSKCSAGFAVINYKAEKYLNITSQVILYLCNVIGVILLFVGAINCEGNFNKYDIGYLLGALVSFFLGFTTYVLMQVVRNISLKLDMRNDI